MSNLAIFFLIRETNFIFLFWSKNKYSVGGLHGIPLVNIFQIITAGFLAVALTAVAPPFL